MKKFFFFVLIVTLVIAVNCKLSTINYLYAESFKILGSRPLGMGGAFVAIAEDSLAQYWNPAGLARQKLFDLQAPINVGAKLTGGILKEAKDISNSFAKIKEIQDKQGEGKAIDLEGISNFYKSLENINDLSKPGLGALIELPASLAIRIGRTSWQLNNFTEVGITPSVDLTRMGLGAPKLQTSAITLKQASAMNSSSSFGAITFSTATLDPSFFVDPSTSTELLLSRDQLASIIADLSTILKAGLYGATTTQIANALIKIAISSFGYTEGQVILTTKEIVELNQQLKDAGILTGTSGSFSDNKTMLTLRGASILEISAAYGQPLPFLTKDLLAGVNFKVMRGYVGFNEIELMKGQSTELEKMLTDYTTNVKESYNFGIDLGLMLDKIRTWRTRIGILARNINRPSFDQPQAAINAGEDSKYYVDPQVRAGVAFYPLRGFLGWILAADYDLTKNDTLVKGYKSQLLSLGTEINLGGKQWFNVAVRAGAMKNLEQEKEITYTGGLGINFLHFQFDLAGAMSAEKTEIEPGKEFPSNVQVSGTLTLNF